jgi:hypothetical protein
MESIQTKVINVKKYALFLALYMILGTGITMWLVFTFRIVMIIWIGVIITFFAPLLFQRQFRKRYSRQAILSFFDDYLCIEILDPLNNQPVKKDEFTYSDIGSFRVFDSSKDDSSSLKIMLRNGMRYAYTFIEQDTGKLKVHITDQIFKYFNQYNSLAEEEKRIRMLPNLFATSLGRVLILCVSILLLGSIIMQIIHIPKTLPATFLVTLSFFFIILAQRKRDIEIKKRMN